MRLDWRVEFIIRIRTLCFSTKKGKSQNPVYLFKSYGRRLADLELLVSHVGDEVVGRGGEGPEAVLVLVLIDLYAGEDLVVEEPGDVLSQPVGVGREDARESPLPRHANVLRLHEEGDLVANRGCGI